MRVLLAVAVLSVAFAGCASSNDPSPSAASACVKADKPANFTKMTWCLDTTKGVIRATLFHTKTPMTAWSFVNLTDKGYFDGQKFHRVIKNFMDQGGDPLSKDDAKKSSWGTGGPGYDLVDEFWCADGTLSRTHPATCGAGGLGLKHDSAGVLSMANTGRAQTGGSQFFLTAVPTPHLDGKHAVFGHTADQASLDVALAINKVATDSSDRPTTPVVINKATIEWA